MTKSQLSVNELKDIITGAFVDASDYIRFVQSEDNNAKGWSKVNKTKVSEEVYSEAMSAIEEEFKLAALARMEADIKGVEFDQDDTRPHMFHNADRDEIATIAEMNYDEAAEEIEENGTLF